MADVTGGVSETRALELFASALGAGGIGDIGTYALATLPNPASSPRRTAWVTDLFNVGGRMVSEGGFWKPIRPLVTTPPIASASMTTVPLFSPTTMILTNGPGVGVTHTVTLGVGSGYAVPAPGYRQRVVRPSVAFLGNVIVLGKILTGWADHEWDGTAWVQTASGGLL